MKVFSVFLFLVLINVSQNASAHLKWFAVDGPTIDLASYYSSYGSELAIGIFLLLLLIGLAFWMNRHLKFEIPPPPILKKYIPRLFSVLIGLSLIYASYNQSIIAAHYLVSNRILVLLQYAQAVVGFMLILNLFPKAAAWALIFIYTILATQFGVLEVLDYINFIGIALFLVLFHSSEEDRKKLAVPAIRILTGATLIILAFSEKLLNPDLGLRFLSANEWNFMQAFGISGFSNELFILSAGLVELLIGVLFIFGILTRINTLVLLAFMVTSNMTFMVQNAPGEALTELAGHLPVLAIALILLLCGAGQKWRLR